jgi:hypothetical protein
MDSIDNIIKSVSTSKDFINRLYFGNFNNNIGFLDGKKMEDMKAYIMGNNYRQQRKTLTVYKYMNKFMVVDNFKNKEYYREDEVKNIFYNNTLLHIIDKRDIAIEEFPLIDRYSDIECADVHNYFCGYNYSIKVSFVKQKQQKGISYFFVEFQNKGVRTLESLRDILKTIYK